MTEPNEYFLFLNRLRESGVTNMFGATPYLVKHMKLSKKEASKILADWMRWVSENDGNRDL
jgi:hypothetical protein